MLQSIWKDMTNESTERLCASAIKKLDRQETVEEVPVRKIKLAKIKR